MYKKVETNLNFVEREKEIASFWEQNDIVRKALAANPNGKPFTFYDGPPTANGKPHIGHVLTRVIKDIIPRYKLMKGYNVFRKAGWDTHGLPVELEVEKQLGFSGKGEIEKYGIEPFNKKCKESVWVYKSEWENLSNRVAYWADMEHPYVTYDNNYIESEWWALKSIFDRGLIYQGHKIVPYCPRCGTALSSHEVAQGYKDVEEKSVIARFEVEGEPNTYFLAWTTTPWTLPSNVALCVNADEDYCKIESDGKYYILAQALVATHFNDNYKLISTFKGKTLEYKKYIPLFSYQKEKAYYITCDSYVTLTDGTGIVHIAPAFGEDDANVGRKYGLPFVQLVNEQGKFISQAIGLEGIFCKDADKLIIADLRSRGLLFAELMYAHSYPFCWRCDTPLLYYARKSWYIKMTDIKQQVINSNNAVNWLPETIKSGRMGNFLENMVDWAISRERYWGTPLPFWVCDKCGKIHAVGSRKELHDLTGCDENIELHRPYIDNVTIKCECGGTMHRTPEVADCWFDSGSMPYAQHHYPFENKQLFDRTFPADFISEALDQTRGWFYVLLAISSLLFEKQSFNNCIVLGLVGDKDGVKMSKHKGNVVSPWVALDKQGADAVRWYFYTASQLYLPSRYYDEAVSEAQRKFLGTLWNTYAFFVLYADIDKFEPNKYKLSDCKLSTMDKWVLSRLNSLVDYVDSGLEKYQILETARAIEDFTDELSNWYVRRCRERYWGSDWTADKQAAYVTLHTVLTTLCKLSAPYVPYITEAMYQNLVVNFFREAPISVHLAQFPECNRAYIDKQLEEGMENVLSVVALGRNCRNASAIKNRQPLAEMFVVGVELSPAMQEIVCDELNVKAVKSAENAQEFISYELKPQLKTLGPKYGKLLGEIRNFLSTAPADIIVKTVKSGENYRVTLSGGEVEFSADDLLITAKSAQGFSSATDNGITVALDTSLTPELISEGLLREFVSKIQALRKDSGFVVTDHIIITVCGDSTLIDTLTKYQTDVQTDTLCDKLIIADNSGKQLDINGKTVTVSIKVNN